MAIGITAISDTLVNLAVCALVDNKQSDSVIFAHSSDTLKV